ncbi:hypothetical protein SAMN05421810_102431 [Amycolatopsis arida]|uniref:Uncharacterized protein n=1 Tax=Amycolatopsis arida TaxID=587909 RepID=A0A1I5PWZ4_9PSEU|nr:hypothetical protein CLV69_101431 [Amycolatopsis arida]SFP38603.1 hypothetical protein SAMN05421810_102431 [Amycolatopsis arida]
MTFPIRRETSGFALGVYNWSKSPVAHRYSIQCTVKLKSAYTETQAASWTSRHSAVNGDTDAVSFGVSAVTGTRSIHSAVVSSDSHGSTC